MASARAARAIHGRSARQKKPFTTVNCTGWPSELLDSELFGRARGTLAGAGRGKKGLIEIADGGTLFLDEINNMPISLQAKLVGFLCDQTFCRICEEKERKSGVRIIAATSRSQQNNRAVRPDLLSRLSPLTIRIPSLNQPAHKVDADTNPPEVVGTELQGDRNASQEERMEDLPILIYGFVQQFNRKNRTDIGRISVQLFLHLAYGPLTGGVSELRSKVRRACKWARGDIIWTDGTLLDDIPSYLIDSVDVCKHDKGIELQNMAKLTRKDIEDLKSRSGLFSYVDEMRLIREDSFFRKLARQDLTLEEIRLRYIQAFQDIHTGISDRRASMILDISGPTYKEYRKKCEAMPR